MKLEPAVRQTLTELDAKPEDYAAHQLAITYAQAIDEAKDPRARASAMRWIAPQLHSLLESLGATPAGRTRLKDKPPAVNGVNRLQLMRSTRVEHMVMP